MTTNEMGFEQDDHSMQVQNLWLPEGSYAAAGQAEISLATNTLDNRVVFGFFASGNFHAQVTTTKDLLYT